MKNEKYAWLPQALRAWHEAYISEMCQDDKFMCDELCREEGVAWKDRPCIVLKAAQAIEKLLAASENQPLTLSGLRKMHLQPVWVDCKYFFGWGILHVDWPEICVAAADNQTYFIYANGEYNDRLDAKLYRYPPNDLPDVQTPTTPLVEEQMSKMDCQPV